VVDPSHRFVVQSLYGLEVGLADFGVVFLFVCPNAAHSRVVLECDEGELFPLAGVFELQVVVDVTHIVFAVVVLV
jgi:hypothetical protein